MNEDDKIHHCAWSEQDIDDPGYGAHCDKEALHGESLCAAHYDEWRRADAENHRVAAAIEEELAAPMAPPYVFFGDGYDSEEP